MSKETKTTDPVAKNKADQENLFAESDLSTLSELVLAFGIPEDKIPENPTKEDLMGLLMSVKRGDIAVAKTVPTPEGKDLECPPGHMVIKVTPKALGMEWGQRSREVFFFAINGECVVGKRGATVIIPDKYRSCWKDAIRSEWTVNETMTLDPTGQFIQPAKWVEVKVPAEDVMELYWNRDFAEEKRVEEELVAGSKAYMAEKKAEKALRHAVVNMTR